MEHNLVVPEHYPELRLICWHSNPSVAITEQEAFALYERNWRYIDTSRLTEQESRLIERLKHQFGSGVING